jgi:MraZ protein
VKGNDSVGRYQHTVDGKGRMFIPSKIREDLGNRIFITKSLDSDCLSGYTQEQFFYIKEQLAGLSGTDPIVRKLRREILGEAILCSVDSQGRITITEELWREIDVNSTDEVYIIYMFDKLEIWSKSAYDREREATDSKLSEDLSRYDIKGI